MSIGYKWVSISGARIPVVWAFYRDAAQPNVRMVRQSFGTWLCGPHPPVRAAWTRVTVDATRDAFTRTITTRWSTLLRGCLTRDVKSAGNARPRCPGHGAFIDHPLFLTRRNGGRVPDLNGERPIVEGRLAGIFVEVKNVRLMRIDQLNRADPHRPRAARRQLRRVYRRDAEASCWAKQQADASRMYRNFISLWCH